LASQLKKKNNNILEFRVNL